ncbi:MAG: hypothetical protein JXA43_02900 [Candidatus Diapherotrites archaeon]|nr:hypothetical protein [Candidatus Diapherotrites archaeon]
MSKKIENIELGITNLLLAHDKFNKKFDNLDIDSRLTNISALQALNTDLKVDLEKQDFPQKATYLQVLEQEEKALENIFETQIKEDPEFLAHTNDKKNIEEAKIRAARKKSGIPVKPIVLTEEKKEELVNELMNLGKDEKKNVPKKDTAESLLEEVEKIEIKPKNKDSKTKLKVKCPKCKNFTNALTDECEYCGNSFLKEKKSRSKSEPKSKRKPIKLQCPDCEEVIEVRNPKRPLNVGCPNCKKIMTLKEESIERRKKEMEARLKKAKQDEIQKYLNIVETGWMRRISTIQTAIEILKLNSYSNEEIAKKTGHDVKTIKNWESGRPRFLPLSEI